jgi:hypothetical protein
MAFTVQGYTGQDNGQGYVYISSITGNSGIHDTFYYSLMHRSGGPSVYSGSILISTFNKNGGLKIPGLYVDTYLFSVSDTNDGATGIPFTVNSSTVTNYGPIVVNQPSVSQPTRYTDSSLTIQASGGTDNLVVRVSNNQGFASTRGISANSPFTIGLPRIVQDTYFTVSVSDRDGSFGTVNKQVLVPAWMGCRITVGHVNERPGTTTGALDIYLSELAVGVTQVFVQVRKHGTTMWGTAEAVTPTMSGTTPLLVLPALYNGTYNVRVYYTKGTDTCSAVYGSEDAPNPVSVSNGQPAPDPCALTVSGVGHAPSRAGVNDGKVTVALNQTQGFDVTLRLLQGSTVLYEQTAQQTVPTPRPDPYTFEMTGILPGIYNLDARISSTCVKAAANTVTIDPPELQIGDQLTFLPWVQPTLTHAADGTQGLRPTLSLSAMLRTDNKTDDEIKVLAAEIYGPGDVLGIAQRSLLTTAPAPGAVGFSPLQLAFIDFQDEDLPWRYSTRKALSGEPLPWLMLLVLQAGEFVAQQLPGQPLPSINILGTTAPGPYPSLEAEQQKLWAHVQINATLGTANAANGKLAQPTTAEINKFLTDELPRRPDLAYSRVVCPRRLAPDTAYHAFLVPAVEAGRLAGLGLGFEPADVRASALPLSPAADRAFPVYFQWQFSTGSEDDFETLVGQLHQANATTSAATAPSLAFSTATATYQLPMVGALVDADAPAPAPQAATTQEVARYLYGQVMPQRSASGRPLVSAPLYGRAYFVSPDLANPDNGLETSWKHTLNLDPRYRALAAIGAEVVRDNQEEYVRRAWEQVQDILLANEKLRGAQYGLRTTAGLRDQHLPVNTTTVTTTGQRLAQRRLAVAETAAKTDGDASTAATTPRASTSTGLADYGLQLTSLAMRRVRVSEATREAAARANPKAPALPRVTVQEAIRRSNVPLAAFSPAFRRISKPFGNYQVGQAGRPLRPTQPEPATTPTDLRTPGTSLRQRDTLLTQLSLGKLAAAPAHAETLRGYQFLDDRVDAYLKASVPGATNPDPIVITSPTVGPAFQAAFRAFVTQAASTATKDMQVVGFRKPQYVRPALPLALLKADLVEGTNPGPVFSEKIKTVAPTLGELPTQPSTGDFLAADYNASHFFVGDFDEPTHQVGGDWAPTDFLASDFLVPHTVWEYETPPALETPPVFETPPTRAPELEVLFAQELTENEEDSSVARTATPRRAALARTTLTTTTTITTTAAAPTTDADIPVIKQAKVFPVFKEAMGEALRQRHPELFVPGLSDFATNGVAVLDVNPAFIEAYMVGLNHALGSELLWRGFPVDLRATFFQQFWDVSEHFNATLAAGTPPTAAEEATMLDIKPLDQWISNELGANAVHLPKPGTETLRLAVRSELLRRYPTLVLALQDNSLQPAQAPLDPADPANFRHPLQRLAVGQDMVVVAFDVDLAHAQAYCTLVLMERPGQPKFGLDAEEPEGDYTRDPAGWNDLTWAYAGTALNAYFTPTTTGALGSKPHAAAEPNSVAYLTDSSTVAYALFQEPILAALPIKNILSV